MRQFVREPLLHFFILGALLFGLYAWIHRGAAEAPGEIVVTRGLQRSLQVQFERTRQRPPTAEEAQALVDAWVRDEVLYREGLALGLDRDDSVVRRRVGQKLEFIVAEGQAAPPTTAELQAWLETHPEKYAIEARYSLQQVFFDPARHGAKLDADIAAARRALDAGKAAAGDPTALPPALTDATVSEVQRAFGEAFVKALPALSLGRWGGPVSSTFGEHLVRLGASAAGRPATLQEARVAVERDLSYARAQEASAARFKALREKYQVRIEPADAAAAAAAAAAR
jgi:hypothetical protein